MDIKIGPAERRIVIKVTPNEATEFVRELQRRERTPRIQQLEAAFSAVSLQKE